MAAPQVQVAKAVVTQIATAADAGELVMKFTPLRSYADWDLELTKIDQLEVKERDKLFVDVVAHMSKQAVAASTRAKAKFKVPVDIMIRRRFGSDKQDDDTGRIEKEEIDKLLQLQFEIHGLFYGARLADFQFAAWDGEGGGTEILWSPNATHLREWRQFSALTRINFLVHG